jgi:cardiolipin synthase (CMP-forming)
VLGSYLDPLADKAVIVCTVGALGWVEALSPGMVALLVGRDALLVLGTFARRCGSICLALPSSFWLIRISLI